MDEEGYINKVADWFISKCTPNDAAFDVEKKNDRKSDDVISGTLLDRGVCLTGFIAYDNIQIEKYTIEEIAWI